MHHIFHKGALSLHTRGLFMGKTLMSEPHFLDQGPAQGVATLEGESKHPCGNKEETRQEGKTSPTSWPFQRTGVA